MNPCYTHQNYVDTFLLLQLQIVTALGTMIIIYFVSKYSTLKIETFLQIKSYKKTFYSSIPLVCDNKYYAIYSILQFMGPLALPAGFTIMSNSIEDYLGVQAKLQLSQTPLMISCQAQVKTQPCQAHAKGARTVTTKLENQVTLSNCQSVTAAEADRTTHNSSQTFNHEEPGSSACHFSGNFAIWKNIFTWLKFDVVNNFRSFDRIITGIKWTHWSQTCRGKFVIIILFFSKTIILDSLLTHKGIGCYTGVYIIISSIVGVVFVHTCASGTKG